VNGSERETITEIYHFSDIITIKAIPPFDVNKQGQRSTFVAAFLSPTVSALRGLC
jgi:hypothetical protein